MHSARIAHRIAENIGEICVITNIIERLRAMQGLGDHQLKALMDGTQFKVRAPEAKP